MTDEYADQRAHDVFWMTAAERAEYDRDLDINKQGDFHMDRARLEYLRRELENETITYGELAEIEQAFAELPVESLSDRPENAMASDMLDELEGKG